MPFATLAADIYAELTQMQTVDAHEHLPPEASVVGGAKDFYTLFQCYCTGDLTAAGATPEDFAVFADRQRPLDERWRRFRPYLSAIRTGGYARAALLVVRDVLGLDDLNDDTFAEVSARLQALNQPGLYDRILRERCRLAACIQCWYLGQGPYPDYFWHLAPGPELVDLHSRSALEQLAKRCDRSLGSLDDVLECQTQTIAGWRADPTVVGIKSAHAYARAISFARPERATAEAVLQRVPKADGGALPTAEALALQDYLMFELVARATEAGLPMVFHTGLQAGNYNRIVNANPLMLQAVLDEFPTARIDLFHGGMPWVREIAVLAKYFPGVHLNMAWMHIINPAQARSALSEWLDMVPNTKIFGFGGDYSVVEKVYGHLEIARRNIAAVLAEKVAQGAMSRAVASEVARRLMFDNPNEFYRLGLDGN